MASSPTPDISNMSTPDASLASSAEMAIPDAPKIQPADDALSANHNNTSDTSLEQTSTLLTKLSAELRNRIWRFTIQPTAINVARGASRCFKGVPEPALLRTCRQVRTEAKGLLWCDNVYTCNVSPTAVWLLDCPHKLGYWLTHLSVARQELVKTSVFLLDLTMEGRSECDKDARVTEEERECFFEFLLSRGLSLEKVLFQELDKRLPRLYKDKSQMGIERMQNAKDKVMRRARKVGNEVEENDEQSS